MSKSPSESVSNAVSKSVPVDRLPITVHRAKEIWFTRHQGQSIELVTVADGAMAVDGNGKILAVGRASEFKSPAYSQKIVDHGDSILVPGFVDAHVHCPQVSIIGSGGTALLDWLSRYVFPVEAGFRDQGIAKTGANRLVRELKQNGVTTAAVFSSVHAVAADALFEEFDAAGLRLVTGKTSMDVGAPRDVLQSVQSDINDQQGLIDRWHGKSGRLFYAITPRFALSCSREMMLALGDLRERNSSCYVQTHISENLDEVAAVKHVWKNCEDYLAIYQEHGLVGAKTLLAHGIHLTDSELTRIAAAKASLVHCPTSNLFLGSGLLDLRRAESFGVRVCLASDIGAGTSFSPWQTMLECYKIQALQGVRLSAPDLLYRATLAGAEALGLGSTCGSLEVGKDADFVVVTPGKKTILAERIAAAQTSEDRLFACITLGDDRIVDQTYVAGQLVYRA
jgi:guanine deaminase